MAFDGAGDFGNLWLRGSFFYRKGFLGESLGEGIHEGIHNADISATVTALEGVERDDFLLGARFGKGMEAGNAQVILGVISLDGAVFAHDFDAPVDVVGEGAHLECGGDTVLEADGGGLLVADVVVAVEHAPAVRAILQSGTDACCRLILRHVDGTPLSNHGKVGPIGVEAAGLP